MRLLGPQMLRKGMCWDWKGRVVGRRVDAKVRADLTGAQPDTSRASDITLQPVPQVSPEKNTTHKMHSSDHLGHRLPQGWFCPVTDFQR